jgi:hypothetical protein
MDLILEYAQMCFRESVAELVDDPSDMLHPWRDVEPSEYIKGQRSLAKLLKLDFDILVMELGSDYERARLYDIESGIIPPSLKEEL